VVEVKSKYLHLLHILMDGFERRYPTANGLWRVELKDNDLDAVFAFIRKKAEADREVANSYIEKGLPLAFVARILGRPPAAFAQFVRSLDADIITCQGNDEERAIAYALAASARGKGVVLDEYTVWTAAETGILDILKAWFGSLSTPSSTIGSIDRLIRREEESLGQKSMSIGLRDGQFIKFETTDEITRQQIANLQKLKDDIVVHCEVEQVLVPDQLPEFAVNVVEQFGSRLLDAVFLAKSRDMVLLSDDLRYRQVADLVNGTKGLWLQATLGCALDSGALDLARTADAYVQLALRRHSHLTLNAEILRAIYDRSDVGDLGAFEAITDFIGNKTAEMHSHTRVTIGFLASLWSDFKGGLKCQKATGIIVGKLIRHRQSDWGFWFAAFFFGGNGMLENYLVGWLQGHFMPAAAVDYGISQWKQLMRGGRSRKFAGASSSVLARRWR
jgi:hypothetical protein